MTTRLQPPGWRARTWWLGLIGALAVVCAYNLIFYNRYFPLSEGWFPAYAHLMREGAVPYRDFYLYLTPLYPALLAAFSSVFGDSFIALRVLGIVVMCLIASVLYGLLSHRFPPFVALSATAFSTVYYQSGVAHIGYDFIQFVTLFALLSAYCLVRLAGHAAVRDAPGSVPASLYAALAGLFASLAFLTKQSNGTFVVVFSFVALLLVVARTPWRSAAISVFSYCAGAAAPAAAVLLWLSATGALGAFFDQVLFGAMSAKGTAATIFFGWLAGLITPVYPQHLLIVVTNIAPLVLLSAIVSLVFGDRLKALDWWRHSVLALAAVTALFLACVLWPYIDPTAGGGAEANLGRELYKYIVVISTATYVLLFSAFVVVRLLNLEAKYIDLLVLGTIGFGLVVGNGTSAGIGEVSTFLGLAIFASLLMALPNVLGVGAIAVIAFAASLAVWLAATKYDRPYAWWSVTQPSIRSAVAPSQLALLKGFRVSPASDEVLARTTRIIQENTTDADNILAFPHMPIFYLASSRWPGGKVVVHWLDFLPDEAAQLEAKRILDNPPKVIVFLELPEFVWILHEKLFRGGQPLGHRAIRTAIERLTGDKRQYKLEGTFAVPDNCKLWVWVRST